MSQRRKFRLYIALALYVPLLTLLIYGIGSTAVQRLVPPALFLTTIALLFWRFPEGGLLQISDLRFYIALALFVPYAALLIHGPTPVERRMGGALAYVSAMLGLLFWPKSLRFRRDRF
jgi:hypothetical protein